MIRGIGLRGAVALNVITMIGIGPLITIPLVLADLHGRTALVAWIAGAVIALCDGLAWAELGSLYPGSGGTYVFVREAFGAERWGRLFAFLFAWQIVLSAPLLLASGYIGLAHYGGYLWSPLAADARLQGIVAAAAALATLVLLYRPIRTVSVVGLAFAAVALGTLIAVIAAAATHFDAALAFSVDARSAAPATLAAGLGPALVITLYDYYGYGAACTVGDEVRDPRRALPRSVILSLAIVATLYVALQLGVLGVLPWPSLVPTADGTLPPAASAVASIVVERTLGTWPARIITCAILITAFASTFGNLLAYSRIPFSAARDGVFLRAFARLDARGRFPNVALVVIGLLAVPACFLSLGDAINALTAGLVIVQSVLQLAAVVTLRTRGVRAPYRMALYPVPLLLALAGWLYIFASSGAKAIAFGVLTLAAGAGVYVVRAGRAREWPFARAPIMLAAAAAAAAVAFGGTSARAATAQWGHAAIVQRDGAGIFEVDGKPFFVYGAAFFYERLPPERWEPSLQALRQMGINTLDIYVPWNWHELADGDFDFTGRTSPRRDLGRVLRLARAYGFKILLRPGPVVRNEWRNGGYPAWLLQRPEYGMPLHDLLEGRYPPTATLQNQHSDDAAAEWMRNATHMLYAKRWIERVLDECAPAADLILAVALDDDQGAYIDNQTYPAPNFQAYIDTLRAWVRDVAGPRELTYINTFQSKVTARAPAWAMGNWYQSDAFSIGEHDRSQLEFSTSLLHTQPALPMMASEFQAGWLEQPGDVTPRPADPSNTELALATMIGLGVRGIVNFPAQDTLDPGGWEAPFANAFYGWDAALDFDGRQTPRYAPTARIGALVRRYGAELAAAVPVYDGAIAYLGESYSGITSNAFFAQVAERTMAAERACRAANLHCALVDPEVSDASELGRYHFLIVPEPDLAEGAARRFATSAALGGYRKAGGRVLDVAEPSPALLLATLRARHARPVVSGAPGATFARDRTGTLAGFITLTNFSDTELDVAHATIDAGPHPIVLPPFVVAPHAALVAPVAGRRPAVVAAMPPVARASGGPADEARAEPDGSLAIGRGADVAFAFAPVPAGTATAYRGDVFGDGQSCVVTDNALVRVVVAPEAGARAFGFVDDATGRNIFTTVGALRDDVAIEPPRSLSDRIAKYTHQFPAGMFNRPYDATILSSGTHALVRFRYDAPDVVPHGATLVRTLQLEPGDRAFETDESADLHDAATTDPQRIVSVTSLAVASGAPGLVFAPDAEPETPATTLHVGRGHALGFYDGSDAFATIAWRAGDVEDATVLEREGSIVVRLTYARGRDAHVRYGYDHAPTASAASLLLAAADAAAQISREGVPSTERSP